MSIFFKILIIFAVVYLAVNYILLKFFFSSYKEKIAAKVIVQKKGVVRQAFILPSPPLTAWSFDSFPTGSIPMQALSIDVEGTTFDLETFTLSPTLKVQDEVIVLLEKDQSDYHIKAVFHDEEQIYDQAYS